MLRLPNLIWILMLIILSAVAIILVSSIIKAIIQLYRSIAKEDVEPPRSNSPTNENAQFNPYANNAYYKPVHYPALRVISTVLQIFSFLIFAAGLISAIFIFTSLDSVWQLGIVVLVIAISNSLLLLAIAELVIVLADISISTRATLNQVIDATVRKPEPENKQ